MSQIKEGKFLKYTYSDVLTDQPKEVTNFILCLDYFTEKIKSLPNDLECNTKEGSSTQKHTYSQTFFLWTTNIYDTYWYNEKTGKHVNVYNEDKNINVEIQAIDIAKYLYIIGTIVYFLQLLEKKVNRPIIGINIMFWCIKPNSVMPAHFHDDITSTNSRLGDPRQMTILLDERGEHTEFQYDNQMIFTKKSTNTQTQIFKCYDNRFGTATYWKTPLLHRSPINTTGPRKLIVVVFHFYKPGIIKVLANKKNIQIPTGLCEYLSKTPYNVPHDIDLEIEHLQGLSTFGGKQKEKCHYQGKSYVVRTGARGGKYILVNKKPIYTSSLTNNKK